MATRCSPFAATFVLVVVWSSSASAQAVANPTLHDTLADLTRGLDAGPTIAALELSTAVEVANAPVGSSAGGFVFKLDPATGLKVRTAPTFGPSFAERALTLGEGKMSFAANLLVATYDKLNDFDLNRLPLAATNGTPLTPKQFEDGVNPGGEKVPFVPRPVSSFTSLVLSSETLALSGTIGATDSLDVAVAVPFVKVKVNGTSWVQNEQGEVFNATFVSARNESSGLGDLAVGMKYRLIRFGKDQPDPGGVAVLVTARLPTGSRENLRGLGITRVLGSAVVSSGRGKLRPHGNFGFEWWEKSLSVPVDFTGVNFVTARHMMQYAAGLEFQAGPKITLLTDVLGRHILGAGQVAFASLPIPNDPRFAGISLLEQTVATEKPIEKISLVPGVKWNLKGTFVFSFNGLISVADTGLHDLFTPVVGLDWTF